MIGQVIVPQLLKQMGIMSHVIGYIDNDRTKWNSTIQVEEHSFQVYPPEYMKEVGSETTVFINLTRFAAVLEQLENMSCTMKMDCYITPMLLVHNLCMQSSQGRPVLTDSPLIPKKLHYMWLGGKQIPIGLQKCLDSWERFCPEYEIIQWNEDNYDVYKHPYMKEAYERGAYGFVPDYARLDILYEHGGIYLDTDVELVRSLDPLLYQEAFAGMEKWQDIALGGGFGAVKGHPMVRKFLDARKNIHFVDDYGNENRTTCGFYETRTAFAYGYIINGMTQNVGGMNIYAYDYFLPYDYMTGQCNNTEHTYAVHWYDGGWMDEQMKKSNELTKELYQCVYDRALRKDL